MREPEETTIGGVRYKVAPLPAGKGLAVLARLGKILGPAAARGTGAAGITDLAGAVVAAGGALEKLDPADLDALCRDLAASSQVEAVPGGGKFVSLADCFDVHFMANYGALFRWVKFAVMVNFGPLFKAPGGGAAPGASGAPAA